MSSVQTETLRSRVADRLDPHGSTGAQSALSGVVDLEALEDRQYEDVLDAVDDRLSQARYSLISMMAAGIYFGLLVGLWLVDFSTWGAIFQWLVPVLLVTIYGIYATHQTTKQIRHLSETRSLLILLVERSSSRHASGEGTEA